MLRDMAREEGVGVQYFSFTVYFHSFFFLRVLSLSAGGGLTCYFLYSFQPPRPAGTPPIFLSGTQRERDMPHSVLVIEGISPSPLPCPVALREVVLAIGETHRTLFCGEGFADCLFVIYLSFSSRRSERIWIFFSLSYAFSSCIRSVRLAWSKGSFKAVSTARAIA